ncbi:MAG: patatin family protein [Hyphomicrobiaceae bacterium]|nr:patatin family protein [Hyphomicrobiaceae bacterium]MCC0006797.1 patatin family protein [Hyphomicrobiaceae bacterium]
MAANGAISTGKIGLALGGGAARGWAHIGVLRALEAAGIKPDIIAGTSIGAVVGGCYAAGHLDQLEHFARELTVRRVFGYLDFNFAGTGLISGQRLNERLEAHLEGMSIEQLQRRFTAVATEIGTGHEVWLSRGKLVNAMRASYALPGIFRPVKIDGRWLFDGALVNPIPVTVCRALGARYVIAVNLNNDHTTRGTVMPHLDHFPELPADENDASDGAEMPAPGAGSRAKNAMRRLLQRQMFGKGDDSPGISTVMVEAFNIVQDRIARSRLAGDPPDAIITPRIGGVGLFDFHRADELIKAGEAAAKREIEDLRHEIDARRQHHQLAPQVM